MFLSNSKLTNGEKHMKSQNNVIQLSENLDFLNRLINEHEAAIYLGHSVRTLQKGRVAGGGPKFVKVSARSIRYRRCDLNSWAEARLRSNTSQGDAA